MPDLLEAVKNVLQSYLDDEPKPPLHVGEVMTCWTYLAGLEEALAYEQAGLNTTTDRELRQALDDVIQLCTAQSRILKDFMQKEGIPLPPVTEPKPESEPNEIPLGVKATDNELANGISLKVATAIVSCATAASESIRTDLGAMWVRFQTEMMVYGVSLKSLMKKRGWLKIPPAYYPPGVPHENA